MSSSSFRLGWAQADITPQALPVLITGQFPARLSEGIDDRLTATALALQDGADGEEYVIFVSLDIICLPDPLRKQLRQRLAERLPELDPHRVIFNATHTHTGPEIRLTKEGMEGNGVDLGEAPVALYNAFLADTIAEIVAQAWENRQPGAIAYGLDYAAVARNRRWVDRDGVATMYRLNAGSADRFRHIEGYEDESINLLATYDPQGALTGLIVNIACPSQETGNGFRISADYWCETREELRKRFGKDLFILPQCSAAGDLTPHRMLNQRAHARMLELHGRSARRDIALRIAQAVERILPAIAETRQSAPGLVHQTKTLELPLNSLEKSAIADSREEAQTYRRLYEEEKAKLDADPSLRDVPRWYVSITTAWRRMLWFQRVEERAQASNTTQSVEVHYVRLGEIAFASVPFEYYVDFGMQIKLRSPAIQTFLIQLAGGGTYIPSPRSVAGGGYGSVPASNPVGPEGGQILADHTVDGIASIFTAPQ